MVGQRRTIHHRATETEKNKISEKLKIKERIFMSNYVEDIAFRDEWLKMSVKGFFIDPIVDKICNGKMVLRFPVHLAARILRPETKKVIRNLIKDRWAAAIWR